jgi:ribosome-binding ATPase YchF (GTP1/OBG family)
VDEQAEQVNMVLKAMERSDEQIKNAVAATSAKLEATITEMTKQIGKLTEMNTSNLVKAPIALEER